MENASKTWQKPPGQHRNISISRNDNQYQREPNRPPHEDQRKSRSSPPNHIQPYAIKPEQK